MKRTHFLALCASALTLAALPLAAQDMAVTAGKAAKVVLDNDQVRVIDLHLAPGAKTGMHSHGNHVVYFISGGSARQTESNGTTKDMTRTAGEALWSGPVTHDSVNVGSTENHVLIIELKEPAAPEPAKPEGD